MNEPEPASAISVQLDRPVVHELDGVDRPPTDRLTFGVGRRSLRVRC